MKPERRSGAQVRRCETVEELALRALPGHLFDATFDRICGPNLCVEPPLG